MCHAGGVGQGLLTPNSRGFAFSLRLWSLVLGAALAAAAAWVTGLLALCCLLPISIVCLPVIEVAFYAYWYQKKYHLLNSLAADHQVTRPEAWHIFHRVCGVLREYQGAQTWISQWFHGAALHEVLRDNVLELLAYFVWFQTRDQLKAAGHESELLEMMALLEGVLDHKFADGHNPRIKFMAHLNEPLPHMYRPATVYFAIEFITWVGHCMLRGGGFRCHVINGVSHYSRPASPAALAAARKKRLSRVASAFDTTTGTAGGTASPGGGAGESNRVWRWFWTAKRSAGSAAAAAAGGGSGKGADGPETVLLPVRQDDSDLISPLVVLHGVGLGLLPYLRLLFALAATGAPLLAVEFKHVSMRWTDRVVCVSDLAADVRAALDMHGYAKATLVAHSFGTAVASRFSQLYPERTHQLCLLDPICFNIFIPTVLQNFVYRRLTWRTLWLDLLLLGPARELHCSAGMCRRFIWTQVNLWSEHMPSGCLIVLAGRDDLIPAKEVCRWLQDTTDANILYYENMYHGEVLLRNQVQKRVIHQVLVAAYGVQRHDSATSYLHSMEETGRKNSMVALAEPGDPPPFFQRDRQ